MKLKTRKIYSEPKSGPKGNCLKKLNPKDYRWEIIEVFHQYVHIQEEIKEAQLKELWTDMTNVG